MLPEIAQLEFITQEEIVPKMGTSFLFDFKTGEFVLIDGKFIKVKDLEALKIWIEKTLRTEKFRFKIYERNDGADEYGVKIEDLIVGYNYPQAFIESELKREISSALTKNNLIASISNWGIEKANPKLKVSFKVNLATGVSFDQEVNF